MIKGSTVTGILLFVGLSAWGGDDLQLKPLGDALWRGVIRLDVNGPVYTQFLANRLSEDRRRIIGFVKEKGEMKLDFQLEIEFLINALGEYELLASERFQANYYLQREQRDSFKEEVEVEKRLKYKQKVQISSIKLNKVNFEQNERYDREGFDFGTLRMLPSGRLDKRGRIEISGDLVFNYEGKGSYSETIERQPASEEEKNKKRVGKLVKTFALPITFSMSVDLNKKPTSGQVQVASKPENPFINREEGDANTATYRDQVVASGSFELSPLFSSKKKKKKK